MASFVIGAFGTASYLNSQKPSEEEYISSVRLWANELGMLGPLTRNPYSMAYLKHAQTRINEGLSFVFFFVIDTRESTCTVSFRYGGGYGFLFFFSFFFFRVKRILDVV